MSDPGTLAIIVLTVSASCGLGYFLGMVAWSAFSGRKPRYLYCARCHKLVGVNGLLTSPSTLQEQLSKEIHLPSIEKDLPVIQIDQPKGSLNPDDSATFQRLGMRVDERFHVTAKQLETKVFSPHQGSPPSAEDMSNYGIEVLTPPATNVKPMNSHTPQVVSSSQNPSISTLPRTPVCQAKSRGTHNESKNRGSKDCSLAGQSYLQYEDDKNNQVRLLKSTEDQNSSTGLISKTPGNASGKRPTRPSVSARIRRSLMNKAFSAMKADRRINNDTVLVTQESELSASEEELMVPLLDGATTDDQIVQKSRAYCEKNTPGVEINSILKTGGSQPRRGSPGNTTTATGLQKLAYSSTKDIDIDGPPPAEQPKVLGKNSNFKGKSPSFRKVRKTASLRSQISYLLPRPGYTDTDFTSQSEDERGRMPLQNRQLWPTEQNKDKSIQSDNPPATKRIKTPVKSNLANERGERITKPSEVSQRSIRENIPSPRKQDLPILYDQKFVTCRSRELCIMPEAESLKDASNIEIEAPQLSPSQSEISSNLPVSTDHSRVPSASPRLNNTNHELEKEVAPENVKIQIDSTEPEFNTGSEDFISDPNILQQSAGLVQAGLVTDPQVMHSPMEAPQLQRRRPWMGETDIPHPNLHKMILESHQNSQRILSSQKKYAAMYSSPLYDGQTVSLPPGENQIVNPRFSALPPRSAVPAVVDPTVTPNLSRLNAVPTKPASEPRYRTIFTPTSHSEDSVFSESEISRVDQARIKSNAQPGGSAAIRNTAVERTKFLQAELRARSQSEAASSPASQRRNIRRGTESSQAQSLDWDSYGSDPSYLNRRGFNYGYISSDDRGSDWSIVNQHYRPYPSNFLKVNKHQQVQVGGRVQYSLLDLALPRPNSYQGGLHQLAMPPTRHGDRSHQQLQQAEDPETPTTVVEQQHWSPGRGEEVEGNTPLQELWSPGRVEELEGNNPLHELPGEHLIFEAQQGEAKQLEYTTGEADGETSSQDFEIIREDEIPHSTRRGKS